MLQGPVIPNHITKLEGKAHEQYADWAEQRGYPLRTAEIIGTKFDRLVAVQKSNGKRHMPIIRGAKQITQSICGRAEIVNLGCDGESDADSGTIVNLIDTNTNENTPKRVRLGTRGSKRSSGATCLKGCNPRFNTDACFIIVCH